MKQKNSILKWLIIAIGVACIVTLYSQTSEQSPAAQDPFIKDKGKGKGAWKGKPSYIGNLVMLVEAYTLDQTLADKTQLQHKNSAALYEAVKMLKTSKQAVLENVLAMPVRSGQRSLLESVDEVIFPDGFSDSASGKFLYLPSSFEMRAVGTRVELEPVLSAKGTEVEMSVTPEFVKMACFEANSAEPGTEASTMVHPRFTARKFVSMVTGRMGQWTLLGTMNPQLKTGILKNDESELVTFVFAKVQQYQLDNSNEIADLDPEVYASARLTSAYRFYSLDREKAAELLNESLDGSQLFASLGKLPQADYKLERLMTTVSKSGGRFTLEEIAEKIYGVTLDRVKPKDAASNQWQFNAFFGAHNMRPMGWRIESDSVLSHNAQVVDLALSLERTEYRGSLKGHPIWDQYPEAPVFASQRTVTSVTAFIGKPCFLGTFNEPNDTGVNGRKDSNRVWLGFVEVNVEYAK